MLLVQRTGWGKSVVYFIATRLLRERRAGPTLLVSPLLALMRNQIFMTECTGVRAARHDRHGERPVIAGARADVPLGRPTTPSGPGTPTCR